MNGTPDFYLVRALPMLALALLLLWVDLRRVRLSHLRPYWITFAPFESEGDGASLSPYGREWSISMLRDGTDTPTVTGRSHLGHPIELHLASGRYRVAATRHRGIPPRPATFVEGPVLELAPRTDHLTVRMAVVLPVDDPAPGMLGGYDGVRVVADGD